MTDAKKKRKTTSTLVLHDGDANRWLAQNQADEVKTQADADATMARHPSGPYAEALAKVLRERGFTVEAKPGPPIDPAVKPQLAAAITIFSDEPRPAVEVQDTTQYALAEGAERSYCAHCGRGYMAQYYLYCPVSCALSMAEHGTPPGVFEPQPTPPGDLLTDTIQLDVFRRVSLDDTRHPLSPDTLDYLLKCLLEASLPGKTPAVSNTIQSAAAFLKRHDVAQRRRIDELLAASSAEVEKRRATEQRLEDMKAGLRILGGAKE